MDGLGDYDIVKRSEPTFESDVVPIRIIGVRLKRLIFQ
jgi:hypothetical protein